MTASSTAQDEVLVPIAGGVLDIYGNVIPDELCDDAMEHFADSVNAFMERKFEVHNMSLLFV
jgi:hypothetical protein